VYCVFVFVQVKEVLQEYKNDPTFLPISISLQKLEENKNV